MFERFTKPTPKEEEKEILNRVSQEGPENTDTSTNETEEKVVPDGPDEKKHRALSDEEVIERSKRAANPHGFRELK